MINPPPFELFEELLGRRTDDPRLIELHRTYGFEPPPMFADRTDTDAMGDDDFGWDIAYRATVLVPGCYPPVRARGRGPLFGYLTQVWIQEGYPLPLRDGVTLALPEPEARTRALDSRVAEYENLVHVLHRDERSTLEVRYRDDGSFVWYLLTLNELAEDDPALLAGAVPAARQPLVEPDIDETFPEALLALRTAEIGFEVYDHFESGGPEAWTGNAEAEREFRVFGVDGSGGLVAFWLVHDGRPVEKQPVVFLGSEGDVAPVAADLCDLILLLAAGIDPLAAVVDGLPGERVEPQPAIADLHLERREGRTPEAILEDAAAEYSDVKDRVDALNRH